MASYAADDLRSEYSPLSAPPHVTPSANSDLLLTLIKPNR
jgi:hypothetical protein